ncbi:MAG: class I SAM-dependent methyltransferase [Burkholderiales bacterium]
MRRKLAASPIFAFNPIMRDRFIAREAAAIPSGKRVLDVGAGSCPYRPLFAHCEYRTQDAKPLTADQLRFGGYGGIDYVSDATAMPVEAGSFDVVLCTEMLEHHPHPIDVVRELARVLAPGGKLILTAPLGSGIHQEPYHFYGGYTPYWYKKFLAEVGFASIEIEPNHGSMMFFSQEGIRFLRTTSPTNRVLPWSVRALWAPIWLALLPLLGVVVPLAARVLDRYDYERRFTVGYHVTAVREQLAAAT